MSVYLTFASGQRALADEASFTVPRAGIQFLTGDSWRQGGQTIRLYGVQSCLRGKTYLDNNNATQDCGVISTSFLAAIIHDVGATCRSVAKISSFNASATNTLIAVCGVKIGNDLADLGTLLITQGFAFAAIFENGKPVYPPYYELEETARQAKRGLWAFSQLPHPSIDMFKSPTRSP